MTSDRAAAYKRVLTTLDGLAPSELFDTEHDRIRDALDHLLFAQGLLDDDAALAALMDVEQLCRVLADSGRWGSERAMRLAEDVASCGPALTPEHRAA